MAFDATTELIGLRSSASVEVENFSWSTLPALNNHNGTCSIIIDNYLYAIGGSTTTSNTTFSTACERLNLDIIGATWESIPSFPVGLESSVAFYNKNDNYLYVINGVITGGRSRACYKLQINPTIGSAWTRAFEYETIYGAADNRQYYYDNTRNFIFIPNSYQANAAGGLDSISGIYGYSIDRQDWYYLGYPIAPNVRNSFCAVHNNYLYVGGGIYSTTTTLTNKIYRLNLNILDELYYNPSYLNNIIWEEYYTLPENMFSNVFWYDSGYIYYLVNLNTSNGSGHIVKRFHIDLKFVDDLGVPNFPNTTELHVGGPAHKYKNYIYSLGVRNNTTNNYGVNTGYKLKIDTDEKYYGWNFNGSIRAYNEFTSIQSDFTRDDSIVVDTPKSTLITDGFSIKTIDGSTLEIISPRPSLSSYIQVANISSPVMTSNTTPSGTVTASTVGLNATTGEFEYAISSEYWRGMFYKSNNNEYLASSVSPHWIQYDFGYNFYPISYRFTTPGATHTSVIKAFNLQGSNDGVNFTELDNRANLNLGRGATYYFKLPQINTRYRYYRLNITEMKDNTFFSRVGGFAIYGYTPEDTNNFRADTLFTTPLIGKDIQASFPIVYYFATNNLISPLSNLAAQAIQEGFGPPGNYSLDKFTPLSSLVFNITEDWSSYLTSPIGIIEATLNSGEIFRSLINVPMSTLTGRIVFNIEFNSNITIPIAKLDASHYQDNVFNINITLPMSVLNGTLDTLSSAIQGALDDLVTVVLNTKTLGHTEYTNYNFNTIVKFNNKYFGCDNTRGIFELTGHTDDDEEINAVITSGVNDYLIEEQKRILDFYLNTRYDGSLNIKTIADEVTEEIHTLDDSFKQGIHTERIKLSKGLRGRNWQINITNNNGSDFEIERASILISKGSRRI